MFGQSVFGSAPFGASFEVGGSVSSSGAKGHASGSSGSSGGSGDGFVKKASGTLQMVTMPRAGAPGDVKMTQTCLLDTTTGVLECPYPTESQSSAPASKNLYINPNLLKLFPQPQTQTRQAAAPTYPQAPASKPFPWLLVGIGAIVLGGAGYWYYTKQKKAA